MDMRLSERITSEIRGAQTPEQAYRVFCSYVSEGIGNLIADGLKKSLGDVRNARADVPWQEWLGNHLGVTFNWNTPGTAPGESYRNVLCRGTNQPQQTQTQGTPTTQSVDISVGVGIHF